MLSGGDSSADFRKRKGRATKNFNKQLWASEKNLRDSRMATVLEQAYL